MKIGIFIEPNKPKFNYLDKWKKKIKKIFGKQKYLSHPVHLTIAVFDIKKTIGSDFFLSLKNKMEQHNRFTIYVTKPSIFYNDPLTNGDTLFFKIKKNHKIILFQKKILSHFKKIEKNLSKNLIFKNKKYHSNYKKYGFPFVGNDWIPHFTIASIKSRSEIIKKIYKEFLLEKNFYNKLYVKKFSIWQINSHQNF